MWYSLEVDLRGDMCYSEVPWRGDMWYLLEVQW